AAATARGRMSTPKSASGWLSAPDAVSHCPAPPRWRMHGDAVPGGRVRTLHHRHACLRHRVPTTELHLARTSAPVVELEVAAAAVPIGEDPALAVAPVDDETMVRRAMRVAVDDPRDLCRAERRLDGA